LSSAARGGPQVIPRPAGARAGDPAPWVGLAPEERLVTIDRIRSALDGRVGAASVAEADPASRGSAVLACVWDEDDGPHLLLTRRATGLRSHSGEVSFPGGRRDPGESLLDAALREAVEEVALDTTSVEVLGELDHLMTITSGAFIVPYVGVLPGRPSGLVANPGEVDAVLFVPFAELLLDEVYREERWTWSGDVIPERRLFFFELVGDTLWGATAAMVRQLLGLALGIPLEIDHA
jgi:8-oxo-dGTP pyrophosphatase MutT (NUDIX family)